ncbi:potassium channel AKT1-like protein, partial [Tanacetum coccineum]
MALSNINYYVDVPPLKQEGVVEDRLQLLVNVTGAFKPGEPNCDRVRRLEYLVKFMLATVIDLLRLKGMGDISSHFGHVCYTAWVSPFEFGFLTKPRQPLSIIDNVANGFYGIAIVLTFLLAYLDRSTYLLVDNRKKIAWRYSVVTLFAIHSAGCFYYYLAAHYPNPGRTWIGYGNEDFEQETGYFPLKEDVILQNEAPTDFYVLVTGTVELVVTRNGVEHTVGEAKTGELCGEIRVLCYRPQLFTVHTKRLSHLLRLNRTTFLNIIQANVGDGTVIKNILLQTLLTICEGGAEGSEVSDGDVLL